MKSRTYLILNKCSVLKRFELPRVDVQHWIPFCSNKRLSVLSQFLSFPYNDVYEIRNAQSRLYRYSENINGLAAFHLRNRERFH